MLVEQEFDIKVLTLEQGYDPDLFVRRKGLPEYAKALKAAPRYFDYLIGRARERFPQSGEGKVKALNFLLPHIQRVPSRIARDELANEISQKLGISSDILRQELRFAASARGPVQVKTDAANFVTPSERVLVRALAEPGSEHVLLVREALSAERLHEGLTAEALLESLLAMPTGADPMSLELEATERNLLAEALLHHDSGELTAELVDGALEALRLKRIRARQQQIAASVGRPEGGADPNQALREKLDLARRLSGATPRD